MPRTLYLHVGPRKTGTSALQHILRNHDNSIVVYPKVGLWGDGSHHGLVFRFFGVDRSGKIYPVVKVVNGSGITTVSDSRLSELYQFGNA